MGTRVARIMLGAIGLTVLLLGAGCAFRTVRVGALRTESQSIERGSAETVQTSIRMGVGELRVAGGASKLLEAGFTYNLPQWKPEVAYQVEGGEGLLTVTQPRGSATPAGNVRYEWDLRLNDATPMDLQLDLGVGKSDLKLSSLSLRNLDIRVGVGDTRVDLSDVNGDLDVYVTGGVGQATILLPRETGVRVDTKSGIGSVQASGLVREGGVWVNKSAQESPNTLRLHVTAGIGSIELITE